jgi:hypothetical protein
MLHGIETVLNFMAAGFRHRHKRPPDVSPSGGQPNARLRDLTSRVHVMHSAPRL